MTRQLARIAGRAAIAAIAGIVVFIILPTTMASLAIWLFIAAAVLTVAGIVLLLRPRTPGTP